MSIGIDEHSYTIYDQSRARDFVGQRHEEHEYIKSLCDWILDTWEGGERYKRAYYLTPTGYTTNLIRHKREWPLDPATADASASWVAMDPDLLLETVVLDVSADPSRKMIQSYNKAANLSYETRLRRTPTPTKLRQIIARHLAQINKQSVRRHIKGTGKDETPDAATATMKVLDAWWNDVDGRQTSIDEWMRETVGPLLVALGMLDVMVDHPVVRDDYPVILDPDDTAAIDDAEKGCHASFILPQNILWHKLDYTKRYYIEVNVLEYHTIEDPTSRLTERIARVRHWTREGWTLYETDGRIVDQGTHPYRRVPIVRLFDQRHVRVEHVGDPRFFGIVEKSREYYNEESELIYAMTLQCFAILQAPPANSNDAGDAIPTGPGMVYFMEPFNDVLYGYQYISPSTSPLEFMVERLHRLADQMDAEGGLSSPLTATSDHGTRAASGISKSFDQEEASNILAGISMSLQASEYAVAELAATVLNDRPPTRDELQAVQVIYPTQFNLLTYQQMAVMIESYVYARDNAGKIADPEEYIINWLTDYMIRGIDQESRDVMTDQIKAYVEDSIERKRQAASAPPVPPGQAPPPGTPAVPFGGINRVVSP
jgi:hypothetical protein